jgi:hypothetical protein
VSYPPQQPNPYSQPDPYSQPSVYAAVPPPPKKSGAGKIIAIVAVVLVLCCCGGIGAGIATGFFDGFGDGFREGLESAAPAEAKVGDCVKQVADSEEFTSDATLDVVDCSAADADGRVLGIVTGISEQTFKDQEVDVTCSAYPKVEQAYWEGLSSSGKVWCVGPID